jgi:predicted nucleotidyltransferase
MSIGNVDSQLARMLPLDRIAEICRKYDVSQLSVYGLSSEREAASDEEVLFLATLHSDDSGPWGSKLDELETDLSGIVHDKVHVASRRGIEQSQALCLPLSALAGERGTREISTVPNGMDSVTPLLSRIR